MRERHYGFEYLRVLCMLFIVIWHFFVHGLITTGNNKIIEGGVTSLVNWIMSEMLIAWSSIGVNCFVLICGYFLYNKSFDIRRPAKVWLRTFFYTMAIWIIIESEIVYFPMPITGNVYPFVSNYIALVCIYPFLSMLCQKLEKREFQLLLILGALINLSIIGSFPFGSTYGGGGTLLWYIYLYIVACFTRKYDYAKGQVKFRHIVFFFSVLYAYIIIRGVIKFKVDGYFEISAVDYNSLVFFLSVVVFLYFRDFYCGDRNMLLNRFIVWLSPYTFGVYLIHDNPIIRNILWSNICPVRYIVSYMFLGIVLGGVLIIFVTTTLMDLIREKIFKFLHIDELFTKTCKYTVNYCLSKFVK